MIHLTFLRGQQRAKLAKKTIKFSQALLRLLQCRLTIKDGRAQYDFLPGNLTEYYRAVTFFTKEEGTIQWLNQHLKQDDVLFDIGANVGLYSLYAAKLGRGVKIYAFEPHKITFAKLMENIRINHHLGDIFPIGIPLDEKSGISSFHYASFESGTSMSQLGHSIHPENGEFTPALQEIIYCMCLDDLIQKKAVPAPHHIKIDVDGNEVKILKGMSNLLASAQKPKTIQVEINPGQKAEVAGFLNDFGYTLDHMHFTADGHIKVRKGANPDAIAHNAVFVSA